VVLAKEGVFDVTPGGRGNVGRIAFAAWLTLSALACAASAQTSDRQPPATHAAGSRVEATLNANGLEIRRSVSQPPRRFSGERMELKSSAYHAAREKFYGVVMILKYRVRQELYCDGKLFANSLITFTPEAIEFRTLRLGATRPGVAEEDIPGDCQSRT
jgi:hypothetical protein